MPFFMCYMSIALPQQCGEVSAPWPDHVGIDFRIGLNETPQDQVGGWKCIGIAQSPERHVFSTPCPDSMNRPDRAFEVLRILLPFKQEGSVQDTRGELAEGRAFLCGDLQCTEISLRQRARTWKDTNARAGEWMLNLVPVRRDELTHHA